MPGRLAGYWRLREGEYRVIYAESMKRTVRQFDCIFIERRPLVYELFEQILGEQALE
jgi:hypothetical protein